MNRYIAAGLVLLNLSAHAANFEPIEWGSSDFAGKPNEFTSLQATALVNGRPCKMQIDTGAGRPVIWHYYKPSRRKPLEWTVSFAGITKTASIPPEYAKQLSACSMAPDADVVGTLGSGFFEQGTLTIDLKVPALSYASGGTLAQRADAQPMFYFRYNESGGNPVVELRDGNKLQGYVFLDTGSAPMGLDVLSAEDWKRATGDAPLRAGGLVHAFTIPAWGKKHQCFMYENATTLQVGTYRTSTMAVEYCPTLKFKPGFKVAGILGLQSFHNSTIVLDYVSGRWLVEDSK